VCLRGASEVEQQLLLKQPDPRLRTYVIWVPKLRGEEKDVPVATRLVPDARAEHYWDGSSAVMGQFTRTLRFSEDAWDVYLIYGPEARWNDEIPPKPEYWMHQLGSKKSPRVDGPYLDAAVFAARANKMLERR
jgi:hypothetical protein